MKTLTVLGSTGSIGQSVLEVISWYPGEFEVVGLTTRKNIEILASQIEKFHPRLVGVEDREAARILRREFPSLRIEEGEEGIEQVAREEVDMVVVAIVGMAALSPTLSALPRVKEVALANKEILVSGGALLMEEFRRNKVRIFPLDSEPCGIYQLLEGRNREEIKRVIITASGGPFYSRNKRELWEITPQEALRHPVWKMGDKITIDSATLMNKGFEVIVVRWLFDLEISCIDVLIHPEAKIHALVEMKDGFIYSVLSPPDMKYVINYILHYPERRVFPSPQDPLLTPFHFSLPDETKFPALRIARDVLLKGGTFPAVLNAANEVAVSSFIQGKIKFPQIWELCEEVLRRYHPYPYTWEGIWQADHWAREEMERLVRENEKVETLP